MNQTATAKFLPVALVSLFLAACGGGGGSSPAASGPAPTPPAPPPTVLTVAQLYAASPYTPGAARVEVALVDW